MGWIFSLFCFVLAYISHDSVMMVASAVFAVAGAIAFKNLGK